MALLLSPPISEAPKTSLAPLGFPLPSSPYLGPALWGTTWGAGDGVLR